MPVVIGSRDAGRAEEAAGRIREHVDGAQAKGLENAEAARGGPVVLLCVPFRAQSENLADLKEALEPGQILVDATVPLAAAVSGKATRLLGVPQGSAAQQAQEMVPEGVIVVSALHTVSAPVLGDLGHPLGEEDLIAGDSKEAKAAVAEVIRRIDGLRPVNAGRLERLRPHRGAHAAADLGEHQQQDALRNPPHEPAGAPLVALLSGGTGGAKLARGLADLGDLSVVANTADDVEVYGVHVSPDPDLVTYWLADAIDERGVRHPRRHVRGARRARRGRAADGGSGSGTADLAMCMVRTELAALRHAADGGARGRGRRDGRDAPRCCRCATSRWPPGCSRRATGSRSRSS